MKWKNIKNTSENKYELEELTVTKNTYGDGHVEFRSTYALTSVELVSDNELVTREFKSNDGASYHWKRIVE